MQSISSQVAGLETQLQQLQTKLDEVKVELKKKTSLASTLRLQQKMTEQKNRLLIWLLKDKAGIDFDTIWTEQKDGVHVYEPEDLKLNLFFHPVEGETENHPVGVKKSGGLPFRRAKNQFPEQTEEEKAEMISAIQKELQPQENEDEVKKLLADIDETVIKVGKDRNYRTLIESICVSRQKLFTLLPFNEYRDRLRSQHMRLQKIVQDKKVMDEKRKHEMLIGTISPLDERLLMYKKHTFRPLDSDILDSFKLAVKRSMNYNTQYEPFSLQQTVSKITPLALSILSIRDILTLLFSNPYNCPGLVYHVLPKTAKLKPEEAWSFYSLRECTEGERKWHLECHLVDIADYVSRNLIGLGKNHFRALYQAEYGDNIYREDFWSSNIGSQDCNQLWQNLRRVGQNRTFRLLLKEVLIQNCVLQPTKSDKFNQTIEDVISSRRHRDEEDQPDSERHIIGLLFDNLDKESVDHILQRQNEEKVPE